MDPTALDALICRMKAAPPPDPRVVLTLPYLLEGPTDIQPSPPLVGLVRLIRHSIDALSPSTLSTISRQNFSDVANLFQAPELVAPFADAALSRAVRLLSRVVEALREDAGGSASGGAAGGAGSAPRASVDLGDAAWIEPLSQAITALSTLGGAGGAVAVATVRLIAQLTASHEPLVFAPKSVVWKDMLGALLRLQSKGGGSTASSNTDFDALVAATLSSLTARFVRGGFEPAEVPMERILDDAPLDEEAKGAAVEDLVARLWHPAVQAGYFIEFFLTFRTYVEPQALLARLGGAFIATVGGASELRARTAQLRVVNALKYWVEKHFHDFDEVLLSQLILLLDTTVEPHNDKLSRQVLPPTPSLVP
jgi:hypothetical protein